MCLWWVVRVWPIEGVCAQMCGCACKWRMGDCERLHVSVCISVCASQGQPATSTEHIDQEHLARKPQWRPTTKCCRKDVRAEKSELAQTCLRRLGRQSNQSKAGRNADKLGHAWRFAHGQWRQRQKRYVPNSQCRS
jgi:hypothetical protein